jgi:hypothetical protein
MNARYFLNPYDDRLEILFQVSFMITLVFRTVNVHVLAPRLSLREKVDC